VDKSEEIIWSLVRGDLNAGDFERWVYASEQLEEFLGTETYLEVLSAGYRNEYDILDLKRILRKWLEANTRRNCDCITWKDDQIIPLGYETRPDLFLLNFAVLKERNPWLELVRCQECGQGWYVATDTRDDEYSLLRLTEGQIDEIVLHDKWPTVFDDLKNVWPDPNYK
jgi:hypothetical protein